MEFQFDGSEGSISVRVWEHRGARRLVVIATGTASTSSATTTSPARFTPAVPQYTARITSGTVAPRASAFS